MYLVSQTNFNSTFNNVDNQANNDSMVWMIIFLSLIPLVVIIALALGLIKCYYRSIRFQTNSVEPLKDSQSNYENNSFKTVKNNEYETVDIEPLKHSQSNPENNSFETVKNNEYETVEIGSLSVIQPKGQKPSVYFVENHYQRQKIIEKQTGIIYVTIF